MGNFNVTVKDGKAILTRKGKGAPVLDGAAPEASQEDADKAAETAETTDAPVEPAADKQRNKPGGPRP